MKPLTQMKKIDKSDMLSLLLDFPGQCLAAFDIAKKAKLPPLEDPANNIVFAGLGGSAIGADLVRSYLYFDSKVPITVVREYELPAYVDKNSIVFVCSYSGNTEETLAAYEDAKRRKAAIIGISSGGKLKEWCARDNITFIEIPSGMPPRCSLGYLSIVPLGILARLGIAKLEETHIQELVTTLEGLRDNCLSARVAEKDNIAKFIAKRLYGRLVVVYAGSIHFDVCALRLRGQLAENSKALASSHVFPEMNHNEIVGWQQPRRLLKHMAVVMLRDKNMHPRVSLRMDITRDILKDTGTKVWEIYSKGEGLLSRIFSLIYIGDFISYYLSILYGIDPTPVERVTYLKKRLAKE